MGWIILIFFWFLFEERIRFLMCSRSEWSFYIELECEIENVHFFAGSGEIAASLRLLLPPPPLEKIFSCWTQMDIHVE